MRTRASTPCSPPKESWTRWYSSPLAIGAALDPGHLPPRLREGDCGGDGQGLVLPPVPQADDGRGPPGPGVPGVNRGLRSPSPGVPGVEIEIAGATIFPIVPPKTGKARGLQAPVLSHGLSRVVALRRLPLHIGAQVGGGGISMPYFAATATILSTSGG